MKINSENYEAFYLDYLEGTLSESDVRNFEAFLEAHPDLRIEEDSLFYLPTDGATQTPQMDLALWDATEKITADNLELFLIAELEQQLSSEKQAELDRFLKEYPAYLPEQKLVQSLVFTPDYTVQYVDKKALIQGRVIPLRSWLITGAAAAACFTIAIRVFQSDEQQTQLANNSVHQEEKGADSSKINKNDFRKYHTGPNNFDDKSQYSTDKKDKPLNQADKSNTGSATKKQNQQSPKHSNDVPTPIFVPQDLQPKSPSDLASNGTEHAPTNSQNLPKEQDFNEQNNLANNAPKSLNPDRTGSNQTLKDYTLKELKEKGDLIAAKTNIEIRHPKLNNAEQNTFIFKVGSFEISRNTKASNQNTLAVRKDN